METSKTQEQGKPAGSTQSTSQSSTGGMSGAGQGSTSPTTGYSAGGGSAAQRAREQSPETNRTSEVIDQTKQTLTEAYDKTSRALNQTYGQAMDYGRENPGKLTLIAFGAGIGLGMLLAGTFSPRSRTRRIVPPVMNALTEIVQELFD